MTRRGSWRSVVLAVLVIGATVAGAVGTASGQTGEYTHSFSDDSLAYIVDFGDYEGQANIQIVSDQVPGNQDTIYAGTISTTQIDNNRVRFQNDGAYDDVQVIVSGPPSRPSFETSGIDILPSSYFLGSTGGDKNLKCGPVEEAAQTAGAKILDCQGYPGISDINTSGTDANQTKIDLYQDGATLKSANDDWHATNGNSLEDSHAPARSDGIKAYVEAVNNGSGEIVAREAAISAVNEYYAVKQENLASRWDSSVLTLVNMRGVAMNETDINDNYPTQGITNDTTDGGADPTDIRLGSSNQLNIAGDSTKNATLVTGETVETQRIYVRYATDGSTDSVNDFSLPTATTSRGLTIQKAAVKGYDNSTDSVVYLRPTRFADHWSDIEAANNQVEEEMRTLANNTYDEIESGELNASALLTPQVMDDEYSPDGDYGSYAIALLSSIGVESPTELDHVGSMTIRTEGQNRTGLLMSGDSPPSGEFAVDTRYDPAAINGTQYLIQDNTTRKLDSNFTITEISTANGTSDSVQYSSRTYETTNTTQLKSLLNETRYLRSQIEAREQRQAANSGIPESDGGGRDIQQYLLIGAAVALALLLVTQFQRQ